MLRILFVYLLWIFPLYSTVDFSNVILGGDPNAILEEHTSIVTGQFVDQRHDLLLGGKEPIYLDATYIGPAPKLGNPYGTLMIFPHLKLLHYPTFKRVFGNSYLVYKNLFSVNYDNGLKLDYLARNSKDSTDCFRITSAFGISNTFRGEPSGQTNVLNTRVHYYPKRNRVEIFFGDGTRRLYAKKGKVKDAVLYCLMEETLKNGSIREFHYDKDHRVAQIVAKTPSRDKTYGFVNFYYHEDRMEIQTSHGKLHRYQFISHALPKKETYQLLREVKGAYAPTNCYYYRQKGVGEPCFPTGIDFFGGKRIEVKYYEHEGGLIQNRIENLHAPVGPNCEMIPTHRFSYEIPSIQECSKATVTLFNGQKNIYEIYPYFIHTITHLREENQFASKEHFSWRLSQQGISLFDSKLISCDNDQHVHLKTGYEYDPYGNIIKEHLWGSLTGRLKSPPIHKGNMQLEHAEKITTHKEYTQDGTNRVTKIVHPSGDYEVFEYLNHTHLVTLHLHYGHNGALIKRHTYDYNGDHILIKHTEDDGAYCHMTLITPTTSSSGLNLPHIIQEFGVDVKTKEKVPLMRKERTYTQEGLLASEKVFDASNQLRYTLKYAYDAMGYCIYETDPLGHETKRVYDMFGNCLSEEHPQKQIRYQMTYDTANRLIRKTVEAAGEKRTTRYTYTGRNLKASETNYQGKKIRYHYDQLDDCRRMISHEQIQTIAYDAFHRPIVKKDSYGHKTRYQYNLYGDITQEIAPDGAISRTLYNLDRTVHQKIFPNQTIEIYTYDARKRLIKIARYDQNNLLYEKKYLYRGKQIVEEIDEEGESTHYGYDPAGRLIEKRKGNAQTTYRYDALGHIACEITHTSPAPIYTYKTYDLLGRIIEEKTESNGIVVHHITMEYDVWGNVTLQKTYTSRSPQCERSIYDAFNRLQRHIDPNGAETLYQYTLLPGDIRCDQITKISPKGIKTIQTYNEADLLVKEHIIDTKEATLRYETYQYDKEKRKIKQTSDIFFNGERLDTYITTWSYDALGNVTCLVEGDRKTQMHYTYDRQLSAVYKASGAQLFYSYDPMRRLQTLTSSDASIDYRYTYDKKGRMTKISSLEGEHLLVYNTNDYIIEETLPTGLTFKRSYDGAGRKTSLLLPDGSEVRYTYRGPHLHTIERNQKIHTFERYDPSGACLSETLIDGTSITYQLDAYGRQNVLLHPYLSHEITEIDSEGLPKKAHFKTPDDECLASYAYDGLNQLTDEIGIVAHIYEFDSHGNLRQFDNIRSHIAPNHKLTHIHGELLTYDRNGNRKTYRGAVYTYDALDRLTCIESKQQKTHYLYDAQHRLIRTITQKNALEETRDFLYDGQCEIGSIVNGSIEELRILGSTSLGEIGATVWVESHNKTYATLNDLYGNLLLYIDTDAGCIAKGYLYSAFGEKVSLQETTPPCYQDVKFPWTFQSKREDPSTGLIHFGRRFYDPTIFAFINPDPKGLSDIPNPYCYLSNNPLLHYDPWGLEEIERNRSILHIGDPVNYFDPDGRFFSSVYQPVKNTVVDVWNSPRFQGALQMGVGVSQAVGGAAYTTATGGVGGIAGGGFVFLRGLDDIYTGFRQIVSNDWVDSGKSKLLQACGASRSFAEGMDTALSFFSPKGASRVVSLAGKSEEVIQYTKSNLRLGQQVHKSYKAAIADMRSMRKEFRLPSGRRIDFLDIKNGKVYELKPNNPRGIRAGMKQLNVYMEELKTMDRFKGKNWEGILEVY